MAKAEVEMKMRKAYFWVAFVLIFFANYPPTKRFASRLDALADKIMRRGMRYKVGGKWKRVFP